MKNIFQKIFFKNFCIFAFAPKARAKFLDFGASDPIGGSGTVNMFFYCNTNNLKSHISKVWVRPAPARGRPVPIFSLWVAPPGAVKALGFGPCAARGGKSTTETCFSPARWRSRETHIPIRSG